MTDDSRTHGEHSAINDEPAAETSLPDMQTAVAWCSPGQLANLMDVDADGGVYLPIRKSERGNFTMPLYAHPPTAGEAVREMIAVHFENAGNRIYDLRDQTPFHSVSHDALTTYGRNLHGWAREIRSLPLEKVDPAAPGKESRVMREALERIAKIADEPRMNWSRDVGDVAKKALAGGS
jgi:hypothetical protein